MLKQIGLEITSIPQGFHVHRTIQRFLENRRHAIETGAGIGMAPDYAMTNKPAVKQVLKDVEMPTLDSFLVYPEEMRSVARVQVFRDFLVSKAQRWAY